MDNQIDNQDARYMVYVGTYTYGESKGIYIFSLDTSTGKLEPLGTSRKIENPSYLAVSSDNRYLYTVMETDEFNGEKGGAVGSFLVDQKSGLLEFMNCQPAGGRAPCHLCCDRKNMYLYSANYREGTVSMFPLERDGSILPASDVARHEGCGPNKERQESAHAHFVTLTPGEKYLCAVDLGIDRVMVYEPDREQGRLIHLKELSPGVRPGSGPRHMVYHPGGSYAYVVNELSSDIAVFKYNPAQGDKNATQGDRNPGQANKVLFEEIRYISTLPAGFKGENYCAAIHVSPDGKFLYASNRGHDSIAILNTGDCPENPGLVSITSTRGRFPRDFAIDPTGNFLFAANQHSDSIACFKILPGEGMLEFTGQIVNVPAPVCVKFARI
ncbi:MAG: lactonase family protein [Clostridiaceae bacterium]|nr:lactonase family protein [Clostridiaceae bacterium]